MWSVRVKGVGLDVDGEYLHDDEPPCSYIEDMQVFHEGDNITELLSEKVIEVIEEAAIEAAKEAGGYPNY